ncbi:unnamed protein product [Bursaphelenchus okinawaensis]|uniref:Uncharacterized protein n=1 Tax=Bursaphelenchus okinawaensis TaxID=465554 RepID=A0A811LJG0_9BILA|nr:unnamed protein product [Bursaphelenchus okinawaensis]CAG9124772.1 unnamed protein product [Bursaphelenchus okinawaensis]
MVASLRSLVLRLFAVLCIVALMIVSSAPVDDLEGYAREARAPKAKFIRFGRAGQKFIRFGRGGAYGPETAFPSSDLFYQY